MQSDPTETILLGTIHGSHNHNPDYPAEKLTSILLALRPAAICVELYSALFDPDGTLSGEVLANAAYPENAAASRAAEALGVQLLPFDRENRNEYYAQTRYHEREERASNRLQQWIAELAERAPESTELSVARLAEDAMKSQLDLDGRAGPKIINSPAYDHLIRIKHSLWDHVLPGLMARQPEHRDALPDFHFLRDEWQERNRIMADNIKNVAARHRGHRIAVVTGSEHRYMLRDLLAPNPAITFREFWQVVTA